MEKVKKIIGLIMVVAVCAGAGWGSWLWYDAANYYTTQDAQISADTVSIVPELTARLKSWDVREGDSVTENQILGRQDLEMLLKSSELDTQALISSADPLVSKAALRAPISGKVVVSSVVPGQVLSPSTVAAVIADTDHMYIRANIEETNIFKIQPGQQVDIAIDAYPGTTFKGLVERVGQATHQAFNTFPSLNTSGEFSKVVQLVPVRISLMDAADKPLMLGMNTTVRIHLNR